MTDMKNQNLEKEEEKLLLQPSAVQENCPPNQKNDVEVLSKEEKELNGMLMTNDVTNNNSNATITATTPPTPLIPVIVRTPRADSKLILQNMEEVLKSVKKKHRAKHRRKRELKKLAQLEAAAAAKSVVNADEEETLVNMKKRQSKKPLQMAASENETATSKNQSILKHFSRTPKKLASKPLKTDDCTNGIVLELENEAEMNLPEELVVEQVHESVQPKRQTNAFEVMMNAQNKSIGTNSPGRDATPIEEQSTTSTARLTPTHVKRKILFQNWAERKGAGKRKLEEEARAAYVENQLEQRAKR